MSAYDPPLNALVHARFRAAFGDPHRLQGLGEQWSLRHSDAVSPINIMVNGSPRGPVVWIFDPNDPEGAALSTSITDEIEVQPLIDRINERLQLADRAAAKRRTSPAGE